MNLSFKPIAAAVITACFISSPLVASAKMHKTFKPEAQKDQPASITLLSPTTAFARDIINKNQTKGGPGVTVNDKLTIGGLLNVDGKASSRSTLAPSGGFNNNSTNDIYVNNANLLFDGDLNEWLNYHVGLAYLQDGPGVIGAVRDGGGILSAGTVALDEAFATIANFDQMPFYGRFGKMYADFSQYSQTYPLTASLTQLLAQTRGSGAQIGAVTGYGFYGSASVLSGFNSRQTSNTSNQNVKLSNYTAKLGYQGALQGYDVNANVSWINDLRDSDYMDYAINTTTNTTWATTQRAGAWALHGGVGFGAPVGDGDNYKHTFNVQGDYVAAIRNIVANLRSKISTWGVEGAYAFSLYQRDSQLSLGYQRSNQADFVANPFNAQSPFLPQSRLIVDYAYHVLPYTTLVLEYYYDRNYSSFENLANSSQSSNTGAIRLSVAI